MDVLYKSYVLPWEGRKLEGANVDVKRCAATRTVCTAPYGRKHIFSLTGNQYCRPGGVEIWTMRRLILNVSQRNSGCSNYGPESCWIKYHPQTHTLINNEALHAVRECLMTVTSLVTRHCCQGAHLTWVWRITHSTVGKYIHSFFNVLREVSNLFRSKYSTQCDLVLLLSIFSILSFPWDFPVAAYIFFLVFPSLLSFPLSFLLKRVPESSSYATRDMTNPVSLPPIYCMCDISVLLDST